LCGAAFEDSNPGDALSWQETGVRQRAEATITGDAMRTMLTLSFCILLAVLATACGHLDISAPAPEREHPDGGSGGGSGM
jgi:hypothetical protein